MRLVTRLSFAFIVLAFAWPASAQPRPPLPPECRDLPNGGNVKIAGPPIVGPVACQSCAMGIGIPANAVVGFSDTSHATCEFKLPNGDNTGHCKRDTTCPPGASRVQRSGVWVCEVPGPKVDFTCPAPPRTTGGGSGSVSRQVDACLARLKQAESQVSSSVNTFVETAKKNGTGGTTPESVGGAAGQAVIAMGVMTAMVYGEFIPTWAASEAACDNNQPGNAQASDDCKVASTAKSSALQRVQNQVYKYTQATSVVIRELRDGGKAADAGTKAAATAAGNSFTSVQQAIDFCLAEAAKSGPRLPR
jgi:hypothetical protein